MKKKLPALEDGAFLLLLLHPALLWAEYAALGASVPLLLLLELFCLLLGFLELFPRVKRRVLFSFLIMLALCVVLLVLPLSWAQRLLLLPFAVLPMLIALGSLRESILRSGLAGFGIAALLYIAAIILLRAGVYPQVLRQGVFIGAALLIPVGLGVVNRGAVSATLSVHTGVTATSRLTLMNRLLSYAFSAIILLIGCIDTIRTALRNALQWLLELMGKIAAFLMSLFPSNEVATDGGGAGGDMPAGLGESEGPSPFWQVMEQIVKYLALALAVALAAYALYHLGKKLARVLAKWLRRIQEKLLSPTDDYEDETVTLHANEDKSADRRARRAKKAALPGRWEDMSARARLRYVAGVLMAKKNPRPADTPRGLIEDQKLTSAYETARYSTAPIPPEQAALADEAYAQIRRGASLIPPKGSSRP